MLFNVGQPSDMSAQNYPNTGSMSHICWVIPLIDQSRPRENAMALLMWRIT